MTELLFPIIARVARSISPGIQVTQSLADFYMTDEGQDLELANIIEKLESLLETFQQLERLQRYVDTFQQLEKFLPYRYPPAERTVAFIESSTFSCDEKIRELQDEYQTFNETLRSEEMHAFQIPRHTTTYPFRQSTFQKLNEIISNIQLNLSSIMRELQFDLTWRYGDDISELKKLWELVKPDDKRIFLVATETIDEHLAACGKKYPGTGMWLIKSPQFSKWLTEENSFLWLRGSAGSGKSILCSTAIHAALHHRGQDGGIGIAFFYFTFDDWWKLGELSMIQALMNQLAAQCQGSPADLMFQDKMQHPHAPSLKLLLNYFRRLIHRFSQVYIFLDALDENPRNGPREQVLHILETMQKWDMQQLHFFVTSRDESDICGLFKHLATQQIAMQNADTDEDIGNFISGRLKEDRRLRKLLPYHDRIQEVLVKRARGVFRWVECQLSSLQLYPRSENHLDKMLESLPVSLDETYARMLCNIDSYLIDDARRILTLLCFAQRPMSVSQLIDGIAIDVKGVMGLKKNRRLQGSDDIHQICLGFVENGGWGKGLRFTPKDDEKESIIRIAHFSIREYLVSERIQHQRAAIFSLNSVTIHAELAQIYLIYLLEDGLLKSTVAKDFPLARFAAWSWPDHYKSTIGPVPELDRLVIQLFERQQSFAIWLYLSNMQGDHLEVDPIMSPIYYASALGFTRILPSLIDRQQVGSMNMSALSPVIVNQIDAEAGDYGNALQVASFEGHDQIVHILLDRGANVNATGGWGNALQLASTQGHFQVVQTLLDRGAKVKGKLGEEAVRCASRNHHDEVVQMLLDNGAEVSLMY